MTKKGTQTIFFPTSPVSKTKINNKFPPSKPRGLSSKEFSKSSVKSKKRKTEKLRESATTY